MRIVHRLTVKLRPMIRRPLATRRHWSVISMAIVKVVIHMSIEVIWSVEPGSRSNEHATREPLRSVISIRCAVVGRNFVISVRANRRSADFHCNLSWRTRTRGEKQAHTYSQHSYIF